MLIFTLVNRMHVPLRLTIQSIFGSIYRLLTNINMNSSSKFTIDDFTTVFVPLTVADIKYLSNVFESWIALIGNPNEMASYINGLLKLMLESLDTFSFRALHRDNG